MLAKESISPQGAAVDGSVPAHQDLFQIQSGGNYHLGCCIGRKPEAMVAVNGLAAVSGKQVVVPADSIVNSEDELGEVVFIFPSYGAKKSSGGLDVLENFRNQEIIPIVTCGDSGKLIAENIGTGGVLKTEFVLDVADTGFLDVDTVTTQGAFTKSAVQPFSAFHFLVQLFDIMVHTADMNDLLPRDHFAEEINPGSVAVIFFIKYELGPQGV